MCGDDVNHIPSSSATTTLGLDSRGLGLCYYNYTAPAHGSFVSPTSSRSPRPLRNAIPENVKKTYKQVRTLRAEHSAKESLNETITI